MHDDKGTITARMKNKNTETTVFNWSFEVTHRTSQPCQQPTRLVGANAPMNEVSFAVVR